MDLTLDAERHEKIIDAMLNDCFCVLTADLGTGKTKLIRDSTDNGRIKELIVKAGGLYDEFIKLYLNYYALIPKGRDLFEEFRLDRIRSELSDKLFFPVMCSLLYRGTYRAVKVSFFNLSLNDTGIKDICVIGFEFIEGVVKNNPEMRETTDLLRALARFYTAIFHIDLDNDSFAILRAQNVVFREVFHNAAHKCPCSQCFKEFEDMYVLEEDRKYFHRMTQIPFIKSRLSEDESFSFRYRVADKSRGEVFEARFIRSENASKSNLIILTIRCADADAIEEFKVQQKVENANKQLKKALEKEKVYKKELTTALDSARLAVTAKTDFLSRMSHDIRTPMNAIIGMTAIAGAHIDDREKLRDCLTKISASSRHLLSIINDILDMSKIESGKMELREESFSLNELMEDIIDLISLQMKSKGQELKVYINVTHENVLGDRSHLEQALVNILTNAVKYTPEEGKITISVTEKKTGNPKTACYDFICEDNGMGMSEELVERIFEPFERGEDLRISKIQGTGLGMPITKNILELMGGTIKVKSAEGKGSKFTASVVMKILDTKEDGGDELEGLRVLVVDDDVIFCESTCLTLSEIGMEGEWVLTGMEAIEKTAARHSAGEDYFAIIIDWQMPEMDGVETAKRIREAVGGGIPIIIISAYDWSDIEEQARDAGVNAFIRKPVFRSGLRNTFRSLVHPEAVEDPIIDNFDLLAKSDFSGKRILLVEDNDLNREIAVEIIETAGVKVYEAVDGKQALDMVKNSADYFYDMILMDIQMPVMNGHDSARAIRAVDREYCRSVPIIAMTANTFNEDVEASLASGMNEHLPKPIDFRQLSDIMNRWLK